MKHHGQIPKLRFLRETHPTRKGHNVREKRRYRLEFLHAPVPHAKSTLQEKSPQGTLDQVLQARLNLGVIFPRYF